MQSTKSYPRVGKLALEGNSPSAPEQAPSAKWSVVASWSRGTTVCYRVQHGGTRVPHVFSRHFRAFRNAGTARYKIRVHMFPNSRVLACGNTCTFIYKNLFPGVPGTFYITGTFLKPGLLYKTQVLREELFPSDPRHQHPDIVRFCMCAPRVIDKHHASMHSRGSTAKTYTPHPVAKGICAEPY